MIPVGKSTRRTAPPHTSQADGPSSLMGWITSMVVPQSRHR
jgi:hypothetical protein